MLCYWNQIGAVVGVMYCSGLSANELRRIISETTIMENDTLKDVVAKKHMFEWLNFITPQFGGHGLLKAESFINFLFESIKARTFEEFAIPLRVVASDFWTREQVILDHGELAPAIQASMSLPGVFTPVTMGESVLIDGGAVNPVPFDLLPKECDLTIAIDVIGNRTAGSNRMPSLQEAIFNTFQIMEKSIIREKMRTVSPDIYIEIEISNIRALEFYKANQVFKQAQKAKDQLKKALEKRIQHPIN
ncbi:MAG TPA: patatin-like phospholipase family protein [Syntrophales bacterium]|nr:patatin-like phospholipase family protein [Syntrophales bacterium]